MNTENIEKKVWKSTVNWELHKKQKESGENKSQMSNTKKGGQLSLLAHKKGVCKYKWHTCQHFRN